MAYITRKVSDLTGTEGDEKAFASIIVRSHPKIDAPVALDALPDEIKDLKEAIDIVVMEVRLPGETTPREFLVRLADFNKLSPDIDEALANARGTRGRPKGYRPGT